MLKPNEILEMDWIELLQIDYTMIDFMLSEMEVLHMLKSKDCYWRFDYEMARMVRLFHIITKGKKHTDVFLHFKPVLQEAPNLRLILAHQLKMNWDKLINQGVIEPPDRVVGVPDAASELARDFADIIGVPVIEVKKNSAKAMYIPEGAADNFEPRSSIQIVEDLANEATGVKEDISLLWRSLDNPTIIKEILYIANRMVIQSFEVDGIKGKFNINPVIEHRAFNFEVDKKTGKCSHCLKYDSEAIKAKDPWHNWLLLVNNVEVEKSEDWLAEYFRDC